MAVTDCANGFRAVAVHRAAQEPVQKHRFSGFFGTDLDMILRGWGTDTVIISGATTENCCHATAHATARDALFRDYRVVFLSDATAPLTTRIAGSGRCQRPRSTRATLVILASSAAQRDVRRGDEVPTSIRCPAVAALPKRPQGRQEIT